LKNTLAYYVDLLRAVKSFVVQASGYKLHFFVTDAAVKKLECLSLTNIFLDGLIFAYKTRSLPMEWACYMFQPCLTLSEKNKKVTGKRSSLSALAFVRKKKRFYEIDTWDQCYKKLFSFNLQKGQMISNVCLR
jgi:hypothetical protein